MDELPETEWTEFSNAAHGAEVVVTQAAIDHARGTGGALSPELHALASELRSLANKDRELALNT